MWAAGITKVMPPVSSILADWPAVTDAGDGPASAVFAVLCAGWPAKVENAPRRWGVAAGNAARLAALTAPVVTPPVANTAAVVLPARPPAVAARPDAPTRPSRTTSKPSTTRPGVMGRA